MRDAQAYDAIASLPWDTLVNEDAPADAVRSALRWAGGALGRWAATRIEEQRLYVVSTVEDADVMAAPFLAELRGDVRYACLWHDEMRVEGERATVIAPIVHQYVEIEDPSPRVLVVLLSAMLDESVALTSILRMVGVVDPTEIFVLAAIVSPAAKDELNSHLTPPSGGGRPCHVISGKRLEHETARAFPPTYRRLGFSSVEEKNTLLPDLVMERRALRLDPSARPGM